MKSLTKLYRLGPGPSSSHTIAPVNSARAFASLIASKNDVVRVRVTLYGSLALTGRGHKTDEAIAKSLFPLPTEIVFDRLSVVAHPNTMLFEAFSVNELVVSRTYISLGGGEIASPDDPTVLEKDVYPFRSLDEIKTFMFERHLPSLKEFCLLYEDPTIVEYLSTALKRMFECVEKGLTEEGLIPANGNPKLKVMRSARSIKQAADEITDDESRREMLISAYAYAVSESNACGEEVVTAPTCGSSGILPSLLYYEYHDKKIPFDTVRDSLFAGGVFGNLIKQNASIAGAIGGCQAEIGTASSMGAASLCYCEGLSLYQMEYAAEVAMEHFLGLSCDPVDGYVIIPCIERNGMGALRAYDSFLYAKFISPIRRNKVSFDDVVEAMKLTGDSLATAYKETAEGGLAEILKEK
jgi:L-serine dehydratase